MDRVTRDSRPVFRLLIDPPAEGAWNMAVDQALLESLPASGRPVLRFYQWERPTLSLGYFQRIEDRSKHAASRACPVVRRTTGGGAIVHDQELTYSIVIPFALLPPALRTNRNGLYRCVHAAAAEALARWGVHLAPAGTRGKRTTCSRQESEKKTTQPQCPFLCFQRLTEEDGVVGGHKVLGSAQRRTRTTLMQHGSLLWSRSPAAPELPGIADLVPKAAAARDRHFDLLCRAWQETLAARLGWRLPETTEQLSRVERERADRLRNERYGNADWTARK